MEPAPQPKRSGCRPRGWIHLARSALRGPAMGAGAGHWGAPGSAWRPRTSQGPPAAVGDAWARTPHERRQRSPTGAREARGGEPARARLTAPQPRSGARRGRERPPGDRGRSCGVRPAPRARRRRSPAAAAPRPSHRLRPPPAPRALRDGLSLLSSPAAPHDAKYPAPARPAADPPPFSSPSTVANDKPVGEVCFSRRFGGSAHEPVKNLVGDFCF